MATTFNIIEKPRRWDAPFDNRMTGADVDRILAMPPFRDMNPERFPRSISLRGLIRNDTRIRRFQKGEIVVRQGDHGTSAFMILSGKVRVVLKPNLPAADLGRREPERKGFFRMLAQLWSNSRIPEKFSRTQLGQVSDVGGGEGRDHKVFLQDVPRILDKHLTETLDPGDFFGEIAALSRVPRTATIFAEDQESELLEIRWQAMRDFLRYDQALQQRIDALYRQRALSVHLNQIPMFRHLSDAARQEVMAKTEFATYGDYDWSGDYKRLAKSGRAGRPDQEPVIAREGDYPNGIVLIRAGFARLSQEYGHGERSLNYLGCGQHYGFRTVTHNWRNPTTPLPLQYTLRAIGYTHVIVVPTAVMESVVLPSLPDSDLPAPIDPEDHGKAPPSDVNLGARIGADLMEFLTENRFFNGRATMLIDNDRCTRCDDCVRACASTHDNNPRFLRHGPSSGPVMVANACMHCEDPVCMIGCPTGAIHRDDFGGQVVINPRTCIGCQVCHNNCPYDAIRMVEIRDKSGEIILDAEMNPVLKATKCDLCVEQMGGPACQRACPHGALVRINMNDLDAFGKWLKR